MFFILPDQKSSFKFLKSTLKPKFQLYIRYTFNQFSFFPFTSPNKQQRASQGHLFLLSAPCQKRQMMWIHPFQSTPDHFELCWSSMLGISFWQCGGGTIILLSCEVGASGFESLWCALLMRPIKSSGRSSQKIVAWRLIVSPQTYISSFNSAHAGALSRQCREKTPLAPQRGTQQQLVVLWSLN